MKQFNVNNVKEIYKEIWKKVPKDIKVIFITFYGVVLLIGVLTIIGLIKYVVS